MAKNRADLINKTYKVLKKHFQPVPAPERAVLEHMLYACCLENTHYANADEAFSRIQAMSFDWNEVRVTSVSELAAAMKGNAHPRQASANLRRVLHSVFESQYSFDLEHLKKQNLGKTIKDLEKLFGTSPFIVNYITQHGLAGHAIPLDSGALQIMHIVGVISDDEYKKKSVPGLERAIPKKQGIEFGSLLHQFSAELIASPLSTKVKAILLEINPDCTERLPKRKSRKKPAPVKPEPAAKQADKKKAASTAASKKAAASAKKTTTKKPVAKKPTKKKAATKKKATKKKKVASKSGSKPVAKKKKKKKKATKTTKKKKTTAKKKSSTSKGLTKRKPK